MDETNKWVYATFGTIALITLLVGAYLSPAEKVRTEGEITCATHGLGYAGLTHGAWMCKNETTQEISLFSTDKVSK